MRRTLRICRSAWTRFGTVAFSLCKGAQAPSFPAQQEQQRSVPERAASPAKGLFKGVGVLPQQAETAVSGIAGNRSFEPLWEQRHCLQSSETVKFECILILFATSTIIGT